MRFISSMCALLLAGCAVTHKVELDTPSAQGSGAPVTVADERLDPSLKLQTIGGTGGGFMLLEASPPVATALQQHLRSVYAGNSSLQVGIERLEMLSKIGFLSADDMTCGIESTVKVGRETTSVRTRVRNTENRSPLVTTMARQLITACLEAHAKEISAQAAGTKR